MDDLEKIQLAISSLSIFKELNPKKILELAEKSRLYIVKKGDVLLQQGEYGESMFIVISGELLVFVENGSKKKLAGEVGKNEIIGELALLTGDPRSATVIAKSNTELIEISRQLFYSTLHEDLDTHRKLYLYSLKRLQNHFAGWLAELTQSPTPSKIRQIMIVQLVAFPLAAVQVIYLYPSLTFLPLQVSVFISVIINVTLSSRLLLPWAFVYLSWWIFPKKTSKLILARDFAFMFSFCVLQLLFFSYLSL